MATINEYFESAQLAQAAYADLYKGIGDAESYKRALEGSEMVKAQYDEFASKYTVIDQYTDSSFFGLSGSGFSATVFQRKSDSKLYTKDKRQGNVNATQRNNSPLLSNKIFPCHGHVSTYACAMSMRGRL